MSITYHVNEVARRKSGAGPNWKPFSWRRIGPDATQVQGGTARLITRGPRKGQETWPRDQWTPPVVVTDAEAMAERQRYEAETGNCGACLGEGKVIHSVSRDEGAKYKSCGECDGTRRAEKYTCTFCGSRSDCDEQRWGYTKDLIGAWVLSCPRCCEESGGAVREIAAEGGPGEARY